MATRRCRECGEEKQQDQFAMPGGKPSSICRVCYAEDQLGISGRRSSSDRAPKIRTRYGEASGDTYQLWLDMQWRAKMAAASLVERGQHELALEKQRELRKQRWRTRLDIARFLAHHAHVLLAALGQPLVRLLAIPVGIGVGAGLAAWLF